MLAVVGGVVWYLWPKLKLAWTQWRLSKVLPLPTAADPAPSLAMPSEPARAAPAAGRSMVAANEEPFTGSGSGAGYLKPVLLDVQAAGLLGVSFAGPGSPPPRGGARSLA
jgi:hypothetical protein